MMAIRCSTSLRALLLAALILLATASAQAVTITSNEALSKGDDARLDQSVTFSADGIRIADVLAKLSESTGVVMKAGLDKDDWVVYDRKVIVSVQDMKLVDLMRELSSVLRFHWDRVGDTGKWTYSLWQDKAERMEEESLRSSSEDARAEQSRQKRENAISDLVNLSSLGSADVAALKASDPWRYVLATEPLGRDVAEFVNTFPEARKAFMQGQQAGFPVANLPTQVQDMVRRIADSYDSLTKSIGASEDHSGLLSRFDRLQVTINHSTPLGGDDVMSRSLLGKITIGSGVESFDIPIFDPSSPMAKALGKAIVALKSGKSSADVATQLRSDLTEAAKATSAPSGLSRDISSDPAFKTTVKLFDESTSAPLPLTLANLAAKTGYNVVSDYFAAQPRAMAGEEKTLGEQLEAIRVAYGSNWEKSGRLLRFRDQEWFRKRAWEVPQVWLDYWTSRGKLLDGLQFSDLLQIGNLRDDQIDHTIMLTPALVRMGAGDAARNRQILRFYAQLSDEQSKQLDQTLKVSGLTDSQWAALQAALATKGEAYTAAAKGSQSIRLTQTGTDVIDYTFTYYPGGQNDPPVTFKLSTGLAYKTKDEVPPPKGKPANQTTTPG